MQVTDLDVLHGLPRLGLLIRRFRVRIPRGALRVSDTTDHTATTELTSWHHQYARGVCHAPRRRRWSSESQVSGVGAATGRDAALSVPSDRQIPVGGGGRYSAMLVRRLRARATTLWASPAWTRSL